MGRIPSASKLANDCWASYGQWSPRESAKEGSAADIGTRLHKVLESGLWFPDGTGRLHEALARKAAIKLGVYDEFRNLDFGLIDSIYSEIKRLDRVYQEYPMMAVDHSSFKTPSYESCSFDYLKNQPPAHAKLLGSLDLAYIPLDNDSITTIVDWKTGFVEAEPAAENQQLMALANMFGSLDTVKKKSVRVVLAYVTLGTTSEAVVRVDLEKYMDGLKFEKRKASAQNCQYCEKKGVCPAYYDFTKELVER